MEFRTILEKIINKQLPWACESLLEKLNERSLLKEKVINEYGDWKYIPATDKNPDMYKCQQGKFWIFKDSVAYEVDSKGNPKSSSKDEDKKE